MCPVSPWLRHMPSLDFYLIFAEDKRRNLRLSQAHPTARVPESGLSCTSTHDSKQLAAGVLHVTASAFRAVSHKAQGISSLGEGERVVSNEDLSS